MKEREGSWVDLYSPTRRGLDGDVGGGNAKRRGKSSDGLRHGGFFPCLDAVKGSGGYSGFSGQLTLR